MQAHTFIQFQFCPLCRLNHKKGRKHALSKRHQEIVKNILEKFSKKLSEARTTMENPIVKDGMWPDASAMFWCYCCQKDIDKHKLRVTSDGTCTIVNGGMLEHITRTDHAENAAKFLKDNAVEMKRTLEFIVTSDQYLKFLQLTEHRCSDFFAEKRKILQQTAAALKHKATIEQHIVAAGRMEQNVHVCERTFQEVSRTRKEGIPSRSGDNASKGKKTLRAFGDGLTAIERKDEDDSLGNVHSDATPPWLRLDKNDADVSPHLIGPSALDLEKFRQLEEKKKLPADRVGAKFDHKSHQGDSWLPNFGGVWNHGRRKKSGEQFQRRNAKEGQSLSMNAKVPRTTATTPTSTKMDFCSLDNVGQDVAICKSSSSSLLTSSVTSSDLYSCKRFNCQFSDISSLDTGSETGVTFDSSSLLIGSDVKIKPYIRKRRWQNMSELQEFSPEQFSIPNKVSNFSAVSSIPSGHTHIQRETMTSCQRKINHTLENAKDITNKGEHFRLLSTPVLCKRKQ